ncbi:hypothetical protein ACOSQ3_031504 [Xanthoceras sorbifolium]
MAPKGISCLFLGKPSALESSKIKQGNLSPKRNANGKIGNQPELSASSTFQNMNETPKRTPSAVTAKGVNFLSFGNAPLEYSSGKKLSSLLLNSEDGLKSSLVNNVSGHKQASSFCDGANSAKLGNQTTQSVSSTIQMSDEMLKKITPLGMSFLSNKKALTYASTRDEENSLPSSSGQTRSTGNSAQQAVECTLAIASKINAPAELSAKDSSAFTNFRFDILVKGVGLLQQIKK